MALSAAGLAAGLAGADSSALAVDSLGEVVVASEAFSFDTSGAFPAGAGSTAFSSTVADGAATGLSTDGTSALGLAGADSSALAVDSLGEVIVASEAFLFDVSGTFPTGAGSTGFFSAVADGAGSVAFSSTVADGSATGLSTDGTSALGLVASVGAGASVLGAGRSVSAELAEKAVPASADGTSLSSLEPARLLVVPEVPPPPMLALSLLVTTSLAAVGELSDDTGLLSSTRPATSSAATTWSPRF